MPVLGMARHSAVRVLMTSTGMVRRDDRLLQVIISGTSASIDSDLLVRGLLEPLGRLALGEAARHPAGAEVAAIGQVLEAHRCLLWRKATACTHIERRAARFLASSIHRRGIGADPQ